MRHCLPDLVTGKGQNGSEQLCQGVNDQEQGGLCAAAAQAVRQLAVQPILDDVQIEGGQFHNAEVIDLVGNHVELVVVIRLAAGFHQSAQLCQRPLVQLFQLICRYQIVGVEAVQVTQTVTGGVAELQVVLCDLNAMV